jgi:predicted transcriptional regulator
VTHVLIGMALLSVIRRWHFRKGMPIREIERRTGLSRNTIRKHLRSGALERLIFRLWIPPRKGEK